jgi:hypothetical protein
LEDHDDLLCKLTTTLEKQEKVMEVLTQKIMLLESHDNDNGERLNNHSYCLGVMEQSQQVRELGSNPFMLDLILPHVGCLCSVSLGVWDCAIHTRMATCSSFSQLASFASFVHVVKRGLHFQWSVCKLWLSSRRA